ncbi:MAG TPA: DMT family transporter [Candidatus Dojkabacteria bacterium]|nr:DMT family transporter [Candidatus Dojkabacteria bacterium]HRO65060.1 DMT family transporter [Candidatus Dojkabacteria bacterium]HRP51192.1 DMT family transporter [Candidatus Dojkabacteria bacterium]
MMKIFSKLNSVKIAPIFVMIAGGLWALDALLRSELSNTITPAGIVFMEHLVGFVIISPLFFRSIKKIRTLNNKEWFVAILLTLVSSVGATLMFTQALQNSFAIYDFSTPVLLQKLQPLFVILFSRLILKEKIGLKLLSLVPLALIGSYMISFGTDGVELRLKGKELIYILSVGAAFCWGFGTILSKYLLQKLSFSEATSLRFFLAIPISFIMMFLLDQVFYPWDVRISEMWRFIVIGLTTGAGAILIYYHGLKRTEAKVATFAELTFPIVSVLIAITSLNPYGEPDKLSMANAFGIAILLLSIIAISLENNAKQNDKTLLRESD